MIPHPSPVTVMVGYSEPVAVPVVRRHWRLWTGPKPLRISKEKPAIRPVIDDDGEPTFAEVKAARELADDGADWWSWIDNFDRVYMQTIYDAGAAASPPRHVLEILGRVWVENGGYLQGAWDAFALFPDGRVAFREVKRHKKDSPQLSQHRLAEAARRAIPDVQLSILEWTAD